MSNCLENKVLYDFFNRNNEMNSISKSKTTKPFRLYITKYYLGTHMTLQILFVWLKKLVFT